MIAHPRAYSEQLGPADVDAIIGGALSILAETGMLIECDEAVVCLLGAGCTRTETGRIRFPEELCRQSIEQAPARWTLHAREPHFSCEMGGPAALLSPGYGSAFVADADGRRRSATMDDFRRFTRMAAEAELVDITGGLLVEPADIPPSERPEVLTRALIEASAKPFFGSVAGQEGAEQSLAVAADAIPNIDTQPHVLGLININSPLRLDARMAEAMLVYVRSGQPIVLTPGILMGITAPATVAGAMVQAFAEMIAGVTLAQVLEPGAPLIIGTGGFGADLRVGGSGFGTPEQALSTLICGQISRRLGIPCRCSPAVTGAFGPDARAGYESMMTALCGWQAGAHLCMQAAGILDFINAMSYEKFAIDLEIWGYIRRMATPTTTDADALALDVIASTPQDYLGEIHTLTHFRQETYAPTLAPPLTYEDWEAAGMPDVAEHAHALVQKTEPPQTAERKE